MKIYALLLTMALPTAAHASVVYTSSDASSDIGGITAGSGRVVVSGRSDASAEVHTVITGGNSGGTSDVEITTVSNGVKHTETRHDVIPAGGAINVSVATSSSAAGSASAQAGARASSTATSATGKAHVRAVASVREDGMHASTTLRHATSTVVRASAGQTTTVPIAPPSLPWVFRVPHDVFSLFSRIFSIFH